MRIEGNDYELEYDPKDPFVVSNLSVAYNSKLAEDFLPVIMDPYKHGSKPYPPEIIAYRIVIDSNNKKLCILYEVYWKRQDCTWKELNKDHDHDYEQIHLHFNLETSKKEKIVVSSVGPKKYAGHGVEVYCYIPQAKVKDIEYMTSSKRFFPWGGHQGRRNVTQIREIPMERLICEKAKPMILVLNCYHAFVGLKRELSPSERSELTPQLTQLNSKFVEKWYYRHVKNRFGHDISKPFEEPYVMYYPPPEDIKSRIVYSFLWIAVSIVGIFRRTLL